MKKYIAYTLDGFTQDSRGKESENCQVLGIIEAVSFKDAAEKCRESLIMWQQSFDSITLRELANDAVYNTHGIFEDDERLEPYDC